MEMGVERQLFQFAMLGVLVSSHPKKKKKVDLVLIPLFQNSSSLRVVSARRNTKTQIKINSTWQELNIN